MNLPIIDWNKTKKIYFVGIKGVGMTPLAIIAKQAGFDVLGSDMKEEFITDAALKKEGIQFQTGFEYSYIDNFFDGKVNEGLLITTGAHGGYDNPQVKHAKQMGIGVLTQGQALGIFMSGKPFKRDDVKGISIAGSHGKTTITGMAATAFKNLGMNPIFAVGTGEIFPAGSPGGYGEGEYFIAEADEYVSEPVYDKKPKFLYHEPQIAIINNIDFDHPDVFRDISEIEGMFELFVKRVKPHGMIIANGDDERVVLLKNVREDVNFVTFGKGKNNDYQIVNIEKVGLRVNFEIIRKGVNLDKFEISVPGEHNAMNAMSVIVLLTEIGISTKRIRTAIKEFSGSKRRFEIIGKTKSGSLIIDDYAHHPIEIEKTLEAIKSAFPKREIICVFQSHTYSRTKAFLSEFAKSFGRVDRLVLIPIFRSLRDTEKDTMKNEEVLQAFKAQRNNVVLIESVRDVIEYVNKFISGKECIVLTMGAGDVYHIGYKMRDTK